MTHWTVGTAGHIDHGKTALIKALTGRATDRLEEEKKRGITIDLGFTYFDLPGGERVGIIDVPGHERFIGNMLAGVSGIDLVLLVIAADEGVMPQTVEHVEILEQLGVTRGLIVLSKCDLVDRQLRDLVTEDVRQRLSGSCFANAPMAYVSAVTGEGIPDLAILMERLLRQGPLFRNVSTFPRLFIDRIFQKKGLGTIAAGTLLSGEIAREDRLFLYPQMLPCRIRGVQVHGQEMEKASAGQRTAVNLPDIVCSQIRRGTVIAREGALRNTRLLDVRIHMCRHTKRRLLNRTRLHLYIGAAKLLCRAVLMDTEELAAGESGYAQLILEEDLAVLKGDRFILRFYSPLETIGGGEILDPNPVKKHRYRPKDLEELRREEAADFPQEILMYIQKQPHGFIVKQELAAAFGADESSAAHAAAVLEKEGHLVLLQGKTKTFLYERERYEEQISRTEAYLSCFHKERPYRWGIGKAQLRTGCDPWMTQEFCDAFCQTASDQGRLQTGAQLVRLKNYQVPCDGTYQKVTDILFENLTAGGMDFVRLRDMDFGGIAEQTVLDICADELLKGKLYKLTQDCYTLAELYEDACAKISALLRQNGKITVTELRDLFGTNRRSIRILLEDLDSRGITRKDGKESERVSAL